MAPRCSPPHKPTGTSTCRRGFRWAATRTRPTGRGSPARRSRSRWWTVGVQASVLRQPGLPGGTRSPRARRGESAGGRERARHRRIGEHLRHRPGHRTAAGEDQLRQLVGAFNAAVGLNRTSSPVAGAAATSTALSAADQRSSAALRRPWRRDHRHFLRRKRPLWVSRPAPGCDFRRRCLYGHR